MIPYAKPSIRKADYDAVFAMLDSHWLTQGPVIQKFEDAVAEYTGAKYCIAMTNGTAALQSVRHLINYAYAKIPAISFKATYDVAPIDRIQLIDIEMDTYNACGADVGVDLAGRYCDGGIVIDSAHSFNQCMPMMDGCLARTLSFHAIKNITTMGEGGAVITNNTDVAEYVRSFVSHGKRGDDFVQDGGNYRMTCAQAAFGLSQLRRANEMKRHKDYLVERYNEKLSGLPIVLPKYQEGIFWHLYIIRTDKRDSLRHYLDNCDIKTQINYLPIYTYTKYKTLTYQCPNADKYGRTALSLPLYADLSDHKQDSVIDRIRRYYDTV